MSALAARLYGISWAAVDSLICVGGFAQLDAGQAETMIRFAVLRTFLNCLAVVDLRSGKLTFLEKGIPPLK
jgi:hypothetical protein